mmetsp:Transcript_17496/g.41545  ORF Transcript_17496/g.41545 Transcript_17496/m.41545 type:complete len:208 (-) Transcript_17496:13-636(-)
MGARFPPRRHARRPAARWHSRGPARSALHAHRGLGGVWKRGLRVSRRRERGGEKTVFLRAFGTDCTLSGDCGCIRRAKGRRAKPRSIRGRDIPLLLRAHVWRRGSRSPPHRIRAVLHPAGTIFKKARGADVGDRAVPVARSLRDAIDGNLRDLRRLSLQRRIRRVFRPLRVGVAPYTAWVEKGSFQNLPVRVGPSVARLAQPVEVCQ